MNTTDVLQQLTTRLEQFSPEIRKAAAYLVENPNDIGVSSMREIAAEARVTPNTLTRMARAVGFEGYEDFRTPFREQIRSGRESFPDRARWLQSLSRAGELSGLYAEIAAASLANLEKLFADHDAARLQAAADAIVAARHTYVLGMGIAHALARNFAYLADMALDNVVAIPREGSLAVDDLARAGSGDVLLAMTFKPYRTEVITAAGIALEQGATLIGISDSPAAPVVARARHGFVVPTEAHQFFTSTQTAAVLLETLMAFVIADADQDVIDSIERFHQRRHQLGIYSTDEDRQA